ncbi:MAG: hypothetical protein ACYS3N_03260 [Planctomycetota bacterium]|jgi:hypothetical protein
MDDWPDINKPDLWEQEPIDADETENGRLTILAGGSWAAEDIEVIKWMTNVNPPRWAMWRKRQAEPEPSDPED